MEKEIMEQLQTIVSGMAQMEERLSRQISQQIKESETRTKVYIENSVAKKMGALFDGYKLTHEKQWELERRMDALEQKLEELQSQIA